MKSFFAFIKKFTKTIIVAAIVLFIVIFSTLFLYEQHKKNALLEERLNRLETMKGQAVSSPDQLYAESRIHIKHKEYDAAHDKLLQLKSNFPYWHKSMVDRSITAVKKLTEKQNNDQFELEKELDQLASTGDEVKSDITEKTVQPASKKFEFRKFEYEDTKFPLKTSNTGHNRKITPKDRRSSVKNKDGSLTASTNEFAFKKFEFEDNRYKKNIKAVEDNKSKISDPNKARSSKDGKLNKHEFEDKRYKKDIKPVKDSNTKISDPNKAKPTTKDTSKTKKNYSYEDPRYKK